MSAEPETPPPALRVLSLGAGVQSTTLLLLAAEAAIPPFDAAIFADTGWEPAAVYSHLERLIRKVAGPASIPVHIVATGNIRADALDPGHRFASMPLHVRNPDGTNGLARRQCTNEYKLRPIKARVREMLGCPHPKPVPAGVFVEQAIGISKDEIGRARDSDVSYARNIFPLLDLGWTRKDCERYLAARGWADTPKSACIGCPFHTNRAWRDLRDNSPAEWADAVDFDTGIRNGSARASASGHDLLGQMYLHPSRVPLAEAPIDRVTRTEWRDRQVDIFDAIADGEAEQGCSPFTCRDER